MTTGDYDFEREVQKAAQRLRTEGKERERVGPRHSPSRPESRMPRDELADIAEREARAEQLVSEAESRMESVERAAQDAVDEARHIAETRLQEEGEQLRAHAAEAVARLELDLHSRFDSEVAAGREASERQLADREKARREDSERALRASELRMQKQIERVLNRNADEIRKMVDEKLRRQQAWLNEKIGYLEKKVAVAGSEREEEEEPAQAPPQSPPTTPRFRPSGSSPPSGTRPFPGP